MVKSVVFEGNQLICSDDSPSLERRVDLPLISRVETGLYDASVRRDIADDYIWELAARRGISAGDDPPLLQGNDGKDIVFSTSSKGEVGRIPYSVVSPVTLTKYVRLEMDRDVAEKNIPLLNAALPEDSLVRLWIENDRRGPFYRGLEVGLNADYLLSVKF